MSDLQFKGNKLSAIQGLKNGFLSGPFQTEFKLDKI